VAAETEPVSCQEAISVFPPHPPLSVPRPGPPVEHIAGPLIAVAVCDASESETAQVMLTKDKLTLSFCAHHFRAHELDLAAAGWVISHDARVGGW
jgi:hypothetical protein